MVRHSQSETSVTQDGPQSFSPVSADININTVRRASERRPSKEEMETRHTFSSTYSPLNSVALPQPGSPKFSSKRGSPPELELQFEKAPTTAVHALRESLQEGDQLVVLIVCHGEIWQQVRTFVASFRQPYLMSPQI